MGRSRSESNVTEGKEATEDEEWEVEDEGPVESESEYV